MTEDLCRPDSVNTAVWLVVINALLTGYIFSDKLSVARPAQLEGNSYTSVVCAALIFIGTWLLLAFFIRKRKNWARYLLLPFAAYCGCRGLLNPHWHSMIDFVTIIWAAIWIIILFKLFGRDARRWFSGASKVGS